MKFLDFIKKYYPFVLAIVITILIVLLFQSYSTLNRERKDKAYQEQLDKQNMSALKDSISVEFNKKLKAYEYSKDNYVVQKLSDLEKYNKSLSDELKKVKGDVIAAIKSTVQGDLGGISSSNDLVVIDPKTSYYGLKFHTAYLDSGFSQSIVGTSKFYAIPNKDTREWNIKPDKTVLDTNLTTIKITYGFKELKDKYHIFAISQSSKVILTDLQGGYFIDKQPTPPPTKPKKWGIGPYIGIGLNSDTKFIPTYGYSVGFSLHYSILQW
jgi:hypothetical protein